MIDVEFAKQMNNLCAEIIKNDKNLKSAIEKLRRDSATLCDIQFQVDQAELDKRWNSAFLKIKDNCFRHNEIIKKEQTTMGKYIKTTFDGCKLTEDIKAASSAGKLELILALSNETQEFLDPTIHDFPFKTIRKLYGYKTLTDNSLAFGEVKIYKEC